MLASFIQTHFSELGVGKEGLEAAGDKRDSQRYEVLLESRDDNKFAVLGVHMSATITSFAHKLCAVGIVWDYGFGICLVVAGRDNVAHGNVDGLKVT